MRFNYDWRQELVHYLFTGDEPLWHGLIGGRMTILSSKDLRISLTNINSWTPSHSSWICH
jgi:hypothetical protein